ncbi:Uncharacterised protein [Mycobacteroides abscessus subsp. abscessus]|nr:Uncharacterised protein [Mycobacteroides abscessus subsp. abscessus]
MGCLGGGMDDDEVAHPLKEVFDEPARILTRLDDPLDRPVDTGAVTGGERVDDVAEQGVRGVAEQSDGGGVVDAIRTGACDELVEHGEGVAHRPAAGTHDEREHALVDLDVLASAELLEVVPERLGRHEPEGIVVGARADRPDDFLGFGRREDELDVRRRLLDDLEQGVEALRGDHVRLVEDEHLVPVSGRRVDRALTQVASVVDAVVAGRVDLDDVERAGSAVGEVAAARALAAGHWGGPLLAVEAPREDPRRGGLAAAARPREQVGMVDATTLDGGLERLGHMLLTDDLVEGLWAVSSVQCGGHSPSLMPPPDTTQSRR